MRFALALLLAASLCPSWRASAAPSRIFDFAGDPFATSTQLDYAFMAEPVNQLYQNKFTITQAVSRRDDEVWRVNGRFGRLGATGTPYPSSLWDLEAGGSFDRKVDATHSWGVRTAVGSASDVPFFGIQETVFQLTGHYRIPSGERNSWLFFLSYSNNRPIANNVPLPGVAYVVRAPQDRFVGIFGLPFAAANYRITDALTTRVAYFFPEDLALETSLLITGPVRAFLAFEWHQESWLPVDRPGSTERLYFDSKAALAGVRTALGKGVSLDLSGGYAFARRFFEADSILRSKANDFDIPASPIAELHLGAHI